MKIEKAEIGLRVYHPLLLSQMRKKAAEPVFASVRTARLVFAALEAQM